LTREHAIADPRQIYKTLPTGQPSATGGRQALIRGQTSLAENRRAFMETNFETNQSPESISGPNQSHPLTPPNARRARSRGRRWLLLAIPVAVGFLSLGAARAQHFAGPFHGGMGGPFMKERIEHLLSAAGASDGQKAQIRSIWDGLHPQLKALHQQHAGIRKQMGEAMTAPTIDTGNIEQLRRQSVATMDKISALMTQGMVGSAQVLTPDQRKIVLRKIEEHRKHGGDAGE
jgi:Spy/CpxP family protein refolding chaperone